MSEDRQRNGEKFLDRWSRLKQETRTQSPLSADKRKDPGPLPQLPSLESLAFDSDFSPFMHPEVDDGLRRTALKKLFSDPHFNRIDGLDVYIDDYTGADPIPADLLKSLMEDRRKLFVRDDESSADNTISVADDVQTSQTSHMADDAPVDTAGLPPMAEPELDIAAPEAALSLVAVMSPPVPQPDADGKPVGAAPGVE